MNVLFIAVYPFRISVTPRVSRPSSLTPLWRRIVQDTDKLLMTVLYRLKIA